MMLQQTTVVAVAPLLRTLSRALARHRRAGRGRARRGAARLARARLLRPGPQHACLRRARSSRGMADISPNRGGVARSLPGIGAYTAAAIAAIAFDRNAAPMDGNVERVIARLFAVATPLPDAKPELHRLAASLVPQRALRRLRPGDDGSGRDDLHAEDAALRALPVARAVPRPRRRHRREPAGAARRPREADAVRRRLLGGAARRRGAAAPPAGEGPARRHDGGALDAVARPPWAEAEARAHAPVAAQWRRVPGIVRHTFTHFHLELVGAGRHGAAGASGDGVWVAARAA